MMNKNLINLSVGLFEKFIDSSDLLEKARFTPPDESTLEELKYFFYNLSDQKIAKLPRQKHIAQYLSHADKQLIAVNWLISSDDAKQIAENIGVAVRIIDLKEYHFLIFQYPLDIKPKSDIDPEILEDEVLGMVRMGQTVDVVTLQNLSNPITLLEVEKGSALDIDSTDRIGYFLLTFGNQIENLGISPKTMDLSRHLLLTEHALFPLVNIPTALSLNEPKYVFLEFYRCLELVFVMPRVEKLSARFKPFFEMGSSPPKLSQIAKWCSNDLGWHRVERKSIRQLMSLLAEHDPFPMQALCQSVNILKNRDVISADWTPNKREVESLADTLYDIRNQVAHQFWPEDEKELTANEFGALTEFIAESLSFLYEKYPEI